VSVARADEVVPALGGGAGILDVKDPARGSLGAARAEVVGAARRAAPPDVAVSAALGDGLGEAVHGGGRGLHALAAELAAAGAAFLKVGLGDVSSGEARRALRRLLDAVSRECPAAAVPALVAVAFVDGDGARRGVAPFALPALAAGTGLAGAMLDTRRKGTSVLELLGESALRRWVEEVRTRGLLAGIAGSLRLEDLPRVAAAGPDVVGLRSAVCVGGRSGRVSAALVRGAREALGLTAGASVAAG
jgi:uncharacterized protein (UPF0264 family)